MKVLITGTAGFIGSHVAMRLLERGDEVIGFDNLSDYYDVNLKKARLARFTDHPNYKHIEADLADRAAVEAAFAFHKPQRWTISRMYRWRRGWRTSSTGTSRTTPSSPCR